MTMNVLVVDDSRIMSERLKDILWETTGVEVIGRAKDPQAAIEMLRILNTELVIVEIEMPGTTGIDLLREIAKRKQPPLAIILTNRSCPQYRREYLDVWAGLFFDKSPEFEKIAGVPKLLIKRIGCKEVYGIKAKSNLSPQVRYQLIKYNYANWR